MHTMEHRWGERVRVRHRIRVRCGRHAVANGILLEVSLSGGFVQTNLEAALLSSVDIEINVAGETLRTSASVVRREFASLALEWSEFAPEAVIALLGECSRTSKFSAPRPRSIEEPARRHPTNIDLRP